MNITVRPVPAVTDQWSVYVGPVRTAIVAAMDPLPALVKGSLPPGVGMLHVSQLIARAMARRPALKGGLA